MAEAELRGPRLTLPLEPWEAELYAAARRADTPADPPRPGTPREFLGGWQSALSDLHANPQRSR